MQYEALVVFNVYSQNRQTNYIIHVGVLNKHIPDMLCFYWEFKIG